MIGRIFLKLMERIKHMAQSPSALPTPIQLEQKAFFRFATAVSAVALVVGVAVAKYTNKNPIEALAKFGIVTTALAVCAHRAGRGL